MPNDKPKYFVAYMKKSRKNNNWGWGNVEMSGPKYVFMNDIRNWEEFISNNLKGDRVIIINFRRLV